MSDGYITRLNTTQDETGLSTQWNASESNPDVNYGNCVRSGVVMVVTTTNMQNLLENGAV